MRSIINKFHFTMKHNNVNFFILAPRIIIAGLYRSLNETMKLLWTSSMKINTVHISDVIGASWELTKYPKSENEIYNIVDDSESTQGSINDILSEIFNINTDYLGVLKSTITKVDVNGVIEEINDKHMLPWAEVCQLDNIENTPLTPYMDEEALFHKHLNLDNTKLKSIGYILRNPKLNVDNINEIINDFIEMGIFPRSLLASN